MRHVSIKDLKAALAAVVAEAEAGHSIIVTRHNRPVAVIGPTRSANVRRGAAVGLPGLRPAVRLKAEGRVRAVLADDRNDR